MFGQSEFEVGDKDYEDSDQGQEEDCGDHQTDL